MWKDLNGWVPSIQYVLVSYANMQNCRIKSNFTILDTDDSDKTLKQLNQRKDIDEKNWPARLLASTIDNWKK